MNITTIPDKNDTADWISLPAYTAGIIAVGLLIIGLMLIFLAVCLLRDGAEDKKYIPTCLYRLLPCIKRRKNKRLTRDKDKKEHDNEKETEGSESDSSSSSDLTIEPKKRNPGFQVQEGGQLDLPKSDELAPPSKCSASPKSAELSTIASSILSSQHITFNPVVKQYKYNAPDPFPSKKQRKPASASGKGLKRPSIR